MRRAFVQMHYQGVNITQEIGEYLTSFRFTEKRDKKADEISFTLSDRDGRWQNAWAPNRGDIVDTVIIYENWFTPGEHLRIDCGRFEVDEDGLASSDSGDFVTIKGMPVSVKSSLSSEKKPAPGKAQALSASGATLPKAPRCR